MASYVIQVISDAKLYHERTSVKMFGCFHRQTYEWFVHSDYDQIRHFFKSVLKDNDVLIGHGLIVDCLMTLEKIVGIPFSLTGENGGIRSVVGGKSVYLADTLVYSQIVSLDQNNHSIEDNCYRPRKPHGTPYDICVADIKFIDNKLYGFLSMMLPGADNKVFDLLDMNTNAVLLKSSYLMLVQEVGGVRVDKDDMLGTIKNLKKKTSELRKIVVNVVPMLAKCVKVPKVKTRNKGTELSSNMLSFIAEHKLNMMTCKQARALGSTYKMLAPTDLHSVSHLTQIKQMLIDEYGWVPSSRTKTGIPQFHVQCEGRKEVCPSLLDVIDRHPWVRALLDWHIYYHRLSMLEGKSDEAGWMKNKQWLATGRLPAGSSGRAVSMRHKHRVVANLPKVDTACGKEIRGLIKPTNDSLVLVGYDVSSLEDCVKGHYAYKYDNGEYAAIVNNENYDVHTTTQKALGLPSRQAAKPINYGMQYGMGVKSLAARLKITIAEAKKHYDNYWKLHSGWKQCIDAANASRNRKKAAIDMPVTSCSIRCKTDHETSSRIIQHTGAFILDVAAILMDVWLGGIITNADAPYYNYKNGIARRLLFMHDEYLWEVSQENAEDFALLCKKSIVTAGEVLELNVKLRSTVQIGENYAECH